MNPKNTSILNSLKVYPNGESDKYKKVGAPINDPKKERFVIVLKINKSPCIENIKNIEDPNEYHHNIYTNSKYSTPYIISITSKYKDTFYVLKDKRYKYKGMKLEYAEKILNNFK